MGAVPQRTIDDIRSLAARGYGKRAVARALGIARKTANRYFPDEAICECGRPATHQGWCKVRYRNSPARQNLIASIAGKESVTLPRKIKVSRAETRDEKYRRWLGRSKIHRPIKLPYWEMYSVIGAATYATRKFLRDLREDVKSDLIVACCEGRVRPDEIDEAARFFFLREWERVHIHNRIAFDDKIVSQVGTLPFWEHWK